ncbi:MAG: NapC/NirT family cytochrome c [Elusimicrobiota bacterium]
MSEENDDKNRRGRAELWLQALLMLGVVAVPGLLALLTAGLSFERAKTVEFCSSCHVMGPFVQGVEDTKSDLLSAKHFQRHWINHNNCYTCHTNYDFFGPVDAKIRGLRHLYSNFTGFKKRPRLFKPFPNGNCLQCHGNTRKYRESPAHEPMLEQLGKDEMKCIECHGPVHPQGETGGKS